MSYDDADFLRELQIAVEKVGLMTSEMIEKQEAARARNHERLVRLGLKSK